MLNIAICDDEPLYINSIHNVLCDLQNDLQFGFYKNAKELLDSIGSKIYDIYILDIEMAGYNGLTVAKHIRDRDEHSIIIFLTNYDKYVFKGYEVNAFRYIRKTEMKKSLPEALKQAINSLNKSEKCIIFENSKNNFKRIYYSDIVMIEKYQKNVIFHLSFNKVIKERITLNEIIKMLPNPNFILIRKGVIVNADHIKFINGIELTLTTGEVCYISRERLKEVKDKMLKYWGN